MSGYGADCCVMHASFGKVFNDFSVSFSVSLIVGILCVRSDFGDGGFYVGMFAI